MDKNLKKMIDNVADGDMAAAGDAFMAAADARRGEAWQQAKIDYAQRAFTEIEAIDKQIEQEKKDDVMDDDAGLDPGRPVGSNMPEPEAPPEAEAPPMNGNGAAMPGQEPTVPGGVEGQADADQEYSGPETA